MNRQATAMPTRSAKGRQRLRARSTPLVRDWPSALAGTLSLGLLLVMAWRTGGYFPAGHLPEGALAFAFLAVFALARPPRWKPSSPALWGLAALAGLAAWTGLSSRWSPAPHTALEDMQRNLVYLGLLGLGVVAAGRGRFSRHLVWGVLAVIAAVVGAGLLSRLMPDAFSHAEPGDILPHRLSYPLSYWNAFGALGVMGMVVALALASDRHVHPAARGLAASLVVGLGAAAYLSFSRGAWLALGAGLVVLALVTTRRWNLLAAGAVALPLLVIAVLRLEGLDALTTEPDGGSRQAEQGRAFLPVLMVLMGLAGGAQAAIAVVTGAVRPRFARQQLARAAWGTGIGVVLLGGGVVYALNAPRVEGGAASRLDRATGFVEREWDNFMNPTEVDPEFASRRGSERLATARGTRSDLYRVAVNGFEANPLLGDGAGGFEYRFAKERKVDEKTRDAHSLYFETLGELGLVGAVLLCGFLAALVVGIRRARRRRDGLTGAQVAAVAGGCTVWAVHSAIDWAWQMPAVTGCALVLAAAAMTGERQPYPPPAA